MHQHPTPRPSRRWHLLLLVALLGAMLAPPLLVAQTPPPPIKRTYGIGDSEFVVGAYVATGHTTKRIDSMWTFLNSLGVQTFISGFYTHNDTLSLGGVIAQLDTLAGASALRTAANHVIVAHFEPTEEAGAAREVQFYPFADSVQSPYWQCKFTTLDGGSTQRNLGQKPGDADQLERWYENLADTGLVAGSIAYGWDSTLTTRAEQNATLMFEGRVWRITVNTFYFATTGHLLTPLNAGVDTSATVFRVEVWHEILDSQHYRRNDTITDHVAQADTAILVRTFWISKGELTAGLQSGVNINNYRTITHGWDLTTRTDGGPGPLHSSQQVKPPRLDIRVYWTGAEKAALRSISFRDTLGELMMGTSQSSIDYQSALRNIVRRVVRGPDSTAPMRAPIIRFYSKDEPVAIEIAGLGALDRLLRGSLNNGTAVGDSLPAFTSQVAPFDNTHWIAQPDEVTVETFTNVPRDTSMAYPPIGSWNYSTAKPKTSFKIPFHQLPAIMEHNGGNYHLPLLGVTRDSIELYETTLQRSYFGRYSSPGEWPANTTHISGLRRAALVSRETGRRLMPVIGTHSEIHLRYSESLQQYDTVVSHMQEAAELRAMVNNALCYGARGIYYYWLGSYMTFLNYSLNGGNTNGTGSQVSFGAPGPLTTDTVANTVNLELTNGRNIWTDPLTDSGSVHRTLPNFYVGWGNRTSALRWINTQWLANIGPVMAKLRWRDGFSIHFGAAAPGNPDDPTLLRPLPVTEIVTEVRSRRLQDTTLDPPYATYVELGLFDKKPGVNNNPMLDTNYLFVVNKRIFERPGDVVYHDDPTVTDEVIDSARAFLMDSLAESRVITLKLNLNHPDSTQYNMVRIREILPDESPLPHTYTYRHGGNGFPREGLDTAVYADSAFSLVLGPGRAALLEIRYLDPAEPIEAGDIRFGSQRKLLWDGVYYHMVYSRKTSTNSRIMYIRSAPIHPHTDSIGQIHWDLETQEMISNDGANTRSYNVFPSLTARIRGTDSVVSVTWDCHSPDPNSGDREIVLRQLRYSSSGDSLDPIEHVDYHWGYDSTQYGTPVASSLDDGNVIVAWSDSLSGIMARLRRVGSGSTWWRNPPAQWASQSKLVYANFLNPPNPIVSQYPTMPALTHIRALDSTTGIAWQTSFIGGPDATTIIAYARLKDTASATWLTDNNFMEISSPDHDSYHPSMDMAQHVWEGLFDGVTWESVLRAPLGDPSPDQLYINFASLYTPHQTTPSVWRSNQQATLQWTLSSYETGMITNSTIPHYWPNTASLNRSYDSTSQNEKLLFSVVYYDPANVKMMQHMVEFGLPSNTQWVWDNPTSYLYGGIHATNSANRVLRALWQPPNGDTTDWQWRAEGWDRRAVRPAVIYKSYENNDSLFRTTRQFLSKVRPGGYMAHGRQAIFRINDSLRTRISVGLHDVWYATDSIGQGLRMIARDTTLDRIDSLWQVEQVLRSESFYGSDSVQIGLELRGTFIGDSATAADARVVCVAELVNSATGAVVRQLDSFVIANNARWHHQLQEPVVDLVSGVYYVRLRIDTAAMPAIAALPYSDYPVVEMFRWVENPPLSKLTKLDGPSGAKSRISAQPNPFGTSTEICFSTPRRDYVSVTVYDRLGNEVAQPLARTLIEAGRYAIAFDGSQLPSGTYLVELRTSEERTVEKLVILR